MKKLTWLDLKDNPLEKELKSVAGDCLDERQCKKCAKDVSFNYHCSGLPWSGNNIWKMKFFQVREKSGNFVDGQGNLERTWKVREKSMKRGKDVLSLEIV